MLRAIHIFDALAKDFHSYLCFFETRMQIKVHQLVKSSLDIQVGLILPIGPINGQMRFICGSERRHNWMLSIPWNRPMWNLRRVHPLTLFYYLLNYLFMILKPCLLNTFHDRLSNYISFIPFNRETHPAIKIFR